MSTKPCLGYPGHTCGAIVETRSRCTSCEAQRRPSPQQRGYDADYSKERATLLGRPCSLRLPGCTGTSTTAHHVDGAATSRRLAPACGHCNFADGRARAGR